MLPGIFALLSMLANGNAAAAQTAPDQFGAWTLQCSDGAADGRNCWLFQRLVNAADNSLLADIRLAYAEEGDNTRRMLFMHAPTGMLLTARPAYRVDNDATDTPLTWHNCTQRRCTALRPIDAAEFARLSAGGQMAFGYQRLTVTQPTVFAVSLVGMTAGFEALQERLERN